MIPDSAIEPIDQRERGASLESVDYVQTVQAVQAPFLILPRVAGEERGVGWNDWNVWNDWNKRSSDCQRRFGSYCKAASYYGQTSSQMIIRGRNQNEILAIIRITSAVFGSCFKGMEVAATIPHRG
jgi:hypothetical protein